MKLPKSRSFCERFPSIRLLWQSPLFFYNSGLFLKINNKRYRLFNADFMKGI